MNNRNRHMQYRRSVYRRSRIKWGLIIGGISLAVLFLLFLIIGNALGKRGKSDGADTATGTEPSSDVTVQDLASPLPPVHAYACMPENPDASLTALIQKDVTAICLPLNTESGSLLYTSSVAGRLNVVSGSTSLSSFTRTAHDSGLYVSGVWYLTCMKEEDDLLRSVLLSESAAVLAEAIRAGMDDILILAPDLSAGQVEELIRFSDTLLRLEPNAKIGFALPQAVLEAENSAVLTEQLAKSFAYLALDCTASEGEPSADAVSNQISAMLYNLLRYKMRVLLPYAATDEAQSALTDAVAQNNIDRCMILPKG